MPRLNNNGLLGTKPNWYRKTPSRNLPNEIWVQCYYEVSPDSFDDGSAYSLHLHKIDAEKSKSRYGWGKSDIERGFVSQKTLNRILKEKNKTIFVID